MMQWIPSQGQADRLPLDPSWDQETGGCVVKEISSAEAGPTAGIGSSTKLPSETYTRCSGSESRRQSRKRKRPCKETCSIQKDADTSERGPRSLPERHCTDGVCGIAEMPECMDKELGREDQHAVAAQDANVPRPAPPAGGNSTALPD